MPGPRRRLRLRLATQLASVAKLPQPAVLQLRIVILSGATGSQDRFKLPEATRAVTVAAGNLKRSGNLNRQADTEPAAAADSELKYFH